MLGRDMPMGKYLGGSQHLKDIDCEWVLLMKEAKKLNIRIEEIRIFFESKRKGQDTVKKPN